MAPYESDSIKISAGQVLDEFSFFQQGPDGKGFEDISDDSLWAAAHSTMLRCDELLQQSLNSQSLSYAEVFEPLIEIDDLVQQLFAYLDVLGMIHPTALVREAAQEASLAVQRDSESYMYNLELYKKLQAYSKSNEATALEGENALYLDNMLDWVELGGHGEPRSHRQKLKKYRSRITELETEFYRNIAEDRTVLKVSEDDLLGLSEETRKNCLVELADGELGLTLSEASFTEFLRSASNRRARQKAYIAYMGRSNAANKSILQKMIYARQKLAGLQGYDSWVHLANDERVADSPEQIAGMFAEVEDSINVQAAKELTDIEALLVADGYIGPVQVYDIDYYEAQLLKERYGVDPLKVQEYFPLEVVLKGIFESTSKMFGLTYQQIDTPAWHPEVLVFEVSDSSAECPLGSVYLDLFAREGKGKHCYAHTLLSARTMPDDAYRAPSIAIIANLNWHGDEGVALLTQDQRVGMYHEFGHALHSLLNKVGIPSLSSDFAETDYIEIISQLMEYLAWDKDALIKHSRHYQTGEPMSPDTAESLAGSRHLNAGIKYLAQLDIAKFDFALHSSLCQEDVADLWHQISASSLLPSLEESFTPAVLEHLAGSYAGRYYSYIYDQIFCSDMASRFEQDGLASPKVGSRLRKIMLEPGATQRGIEMIKSFLGREPSSEAFIRQLGLAAFAEA